jgi:hypothetical protein
MVAPDGGVVATAALMRSAFRLPEIVVFVVLFDPSPCHRADSDIRIDATPSPRTLPRSA